MRGEQEWRVEPLEVPPARSTPVAALADNPAVRLFVDRVRAVPGVLSASISSVYPLQREAITAGSSAFSGTFQIEGSRCAERGSTLADRRTVEEFIIQFALQAQSLVLAGL